jgi:hypothetical protein
MKDQNDVKRVMSSEEASVLSELERMKSNSNTGQSKQLKRMKRV